MTSEEFINLAKTCKDRGELLKKLGNYDNTDQNKKLYIAPLREAAGMSYNDLTNLFIKTPTPTPSAVVNTIPSGSIAPVVTPTARKLEVIRRSE